MDLAFKSAEELVRLYEQRKVSPVEVVEAHLRRIRALDPQLKAYITVDEEQALSAARAAERSMARDEVLPALHGIPVSFKDTEFTEGLRSTSGSKIYESFVPAADSILVERLRRAGAIVLGKTNTPELGMGGETVSPVGGYCVNPWKTDRTSGGSSGGSAVAVAAGLTCVATGSDGAGSINIPSAFCGVFGLKPTHGTIPYGPMANPWPSFHDVGPITRNVRDAALMHSLSSGKDPRDPLSREPSCPDFLDVLERDVPQLRVAWTPDMGYATVDPQVEAATLDAVKTLEALGMAVEEASPDIPYPFDIWPTIARVEEYAAFGHLLQDASAELTPAIRNRLLAGQELRGVDYMRRYQEMLRFRRIMAEFFTRFDLLVTPMNTVPAFPIGQPPSEIAGRAVQPDWEGFTPFAICANLSELPAATVPCGFSSDGLPIGLMIMARWGEDHLLLSICHALEQARPWAHKTPELASI
jgi:Asp-tRNA(Asn)/Glu-tRNA(Gln) amidotransferase A subunit family amidase